MTAWTAPRTWVHAELVTASLFNTHIRDNELHLKENQAAAKGFFLGCHLRTHVDSAFAASKVQLISADLVVLNDGTAVTDVTLLEADITVSGAGGLDTGTEAASRWYAVYIIRKSSDGTLGLMLHRSNNFDAGANPGFVSTATDATTALRDAAARTKISQGFQVTTASTGDLGFVELKLAKVGSPTGQFWVTIETNTAGAPSGSVLATSDKINVANINATAHVIRIPIRNLSAALALATQYHIVANGDFAVSGANYVTISTKTGNPYASGTLNQADGANVWSSAGTADAYFAIGMIVEYSLVLPSGYDQYQQIGFVYNDSGSNFVPFVAFDRHVMPLANQPIASPPSSSLVPQLYYLFTMVPPVPVSLVCNVYVISDGGIDSMALGAVPDGFAGTTSRLNGRVVLKNNAGAIVESGEIKTECQAIYVNGTTAGYVMLSGWQWLRSKIN